LQQGEERRLLRLVSAAVVFCSWFLQQGQWWQQSIFMVMKMHILQHQPFKRLQYCRKYQLNLVLVS
jgi:isoprenylcysteine carboxyl methyltransferase (ICMT) family protein YpbQ